MYIKDGIAYAGDLPKYLKVVKAVNLGDYKLLVLFNNYKEKIVNLEPLLKCKCYNKLNDINIFNSFYIESGILTWCNGEIDISPDNLFEM